MRHATTLAALPLVLALGHEARADKPAYTMADLRALAQQKAWSELTDHLGDVPPAARDAEWKGLAQQAGLGALTQAGQRSPAEGIALSEAILERYPAVRESREFLARRAELGAQAFERCFSRDAWAEGCVVELKPFVLGDPTNQDLAFRLGKLLPPRSSGWLAVPAFAVAIQKKDDPRCQDADVRRAVLSGLGRPRKGWEDVVAQSVTLAGTLCWQALQPSVMGAMGGDSTDTLANTCPFVRTKVTLSNLLTKRCEAVLRSKP